MEIRCFSGVQMSVRGEFHGHFSPKIKSIAQLEAEISKKKVKMHFFENSRFKGIFCIIPKTISLGHQNQFYAFYAASMQLIVHQYSRGVYFPKSPNLLENIHP